MPRRALVIRVLAVAVLCVAASASARSPHDATAHHAFDDPAYWSSVFDDPARDAWQKPAALVAALRIDPGARVADLGAGTGYLSRHLSAAVGPAGSVYAIEVEPKLLAHLRERAAKEGTANVVPVQATAADPHLPAGGVDLVVILDTYHHIDDRIAYLRRLARGLRPGGRVAVIDWQKRPLPVGPAMEHKLPRKLVVDEMTAAGYRLLEEPTVLPYQYFLIFGRRPPA